MHAHTRRLFTAALILSGCKPDVTAPPNPPTVSALFDPAASPPVVPTPNDLAFRGGDGIHLNVPDFVTDSAAQRDFNAYLRTLDGFPTVSSLSAAFSGPLDPLSVQLPSSTARGSVLVIDTTLHTLLDGSAVTATLTPDGTRVVIATTSRFAPGHRYAALVIGGLDPDGVHGLGGELAVASPSFFLFRSKHALIARCADPANADCVCPSVEDPSCHSIVRGVDDDTARAAEAEREQIDPALSALLELTGRARNDVILFWTFTITSMPTPLLDLARGVIPFPNDLLLDPLTGLVKLPITAGDPQAALKMQLNTLDGFSVSAPETAGLELVSGGAIDGATLLPGGTVHLVNLDPRPDAEQPTFDAAAIPGAPVTIALTPTTPLVPDQARYAAILTSAIRDHAGKPMAAAPLMALLRSANPLFDGGRSTVNVLTDTEAAALEPLRVRLQPLVAALEQRGLPRQSIALLWTFTTESIARPLLAMDAFPARASIATDVTLTNVVADGNLQTLQPVLVFPVSHVKGMVLGSFHSETVVDGGTGRVLFDRTPTVVAEPAGDLFAVHTPPGDPPTTIHFWLSLPQTPASPAGAPVVILQHGFTSWRGDLVTLADDFAQAGWAALAFDIDMHGARTVCSDDAQCNFGSCRAGACANGLRIQPLSQNPLACSLQPLSGDPVADCNPLASGNGFIDPSNLFRTRSNAQQYVLDAAQLVRVLRGTDGNGLVAQLGALPSPMAIDPTRIAFLGRSLGALGGVLFTAVDDGPRTVVLNAGAAHLFDAFAAGGFSSILDKYLASIGVQRNTPAYAQLDATARWILDPVDPWATARFVQRMPLRSYVTGVPNAVKAVIDQETGMDTVIPPPFQEALGMALFGTAGTDGMGHLQGQRSDGTFASTYFPLATHATIVSGQPASEGVPMRAQAITFIASGGAVLPASH